MTLSQAITTSELSRRFDEIVAVDGLSVEIPTGSVVGFVGPNGSGKSTTIRMLLGLIRPTAGTATVLASTIDDPSAFADDVGALVESPAFVPNISARANLESMALLRGIPTKRVDEVLAIVGLAKDAKRKVSEYSLGMKQRLGIAIALLPDPKLLILDEPTNGLDPAGVVEIRALLKQLASEARTVVVSSHLLSEIESAADFLIIIRFGELLFAGPLAGLLQQERRFVDVEPDNPTQLADLEGLLVDAGFVVERESDGLRVMADVGDAGTINQTAMSGGVVLAKLVARAETLEDVFLRLTGDPS